MEKIFINPKLDATEQEIELVQKCQLFFNEVVTEMTRINNLCVNIIKSKDELEKRVNEIDRNFNAWKDAMRNRG